ncbi:MAG: iron-sulfur cluster assembly protein [Parcubacteria group bacterium]
MRHVPTHPANSIEQQVLGELQTCYDPEIPVSIVDLGLIYRYQIKGTKKSGYHVSVTLTLTTPGCAMGVTIAGEIESKIKKLPHVKACQTTITFDPPWDASRMSQSARLQLGLL